MNFIFYYLQYKNIIVFLCVEFPRYQFLNKSFTITNITEYFLNFSSKKYFLKVEDITVLKNIDNEIDGQNVEYNRELSLTGMLMKFVR